MIAKRAKIPKLCRGGIASAVCIFSYAVYQALLSPQLDSMLVRDLQLDGQASTCSHVALWQTPISTSCKRKATVYRGDMRLLFIPGCV